MAARREAETFTEMTPVGSRWYFSGMHYEVTSNGEMHDGEPAVRVRMTSYKGTGRYTEFNLVRRLFLKKAVSTKGVDDADV